MKNLNSEDFREIMAAVSVILGFAYLFGITFFDIPEESQRFADVATGVIATVIFGRVFEYYFGGKNGGNKEGSNLS